ncbi:Peroxisome biogenesis protein 3-2 [Linum perenne]
MVSLRDFWRRHKRKILVTAGVVGSGYCLYKVYNAHKNQLADLERQLADERENDELIKAQMQAHFENIQVIADTVTLPHSVSYLNIRITEELDHSYITEALQKGKGQPAALSTAEKLELWDKLKIISMKLKNIVSYAYICLEDAGLIDRDDQQKFLAAAAYLPHSGLLVLASDIQAAVTEALKAKQLKDLFDTTALRETVMQITDIFIGLGSPGRWVDYLMPVETMLHKEAKVVTKFDQLMLETREVILSPEFGRVVEISLKQLIDSLVEDLEAQSGEGSLTTALPLAKLLPRVAQVASLLLAEPSENRYIRIIRESSEVELFFTLLYANSPPEF